MQDKIKEIKLNDETYVLKGHSEPIEMSKDSVIVRSESAGVFCGQLVQTDLGNGGVVKMKNARRLWYWSGAASLSQLAVDGTSKPKDCKFPTPVPEITITKVIEIIPCSEKAVKSLNEVAVWKV